ncbi:MAG: hypothetical protein JW969_05970 [Spirochaetales bacterium]|nr:hypothetical protein [Spirochaetales bacterium]
MLQTPSEKLEAFFRLIVNVSAHKIPYLHFDTVNMNTKHPRLVYINNFSKIHVYDIDFGQGIPVMVIPHNLYDPIVIWPAHPSKGGVEVYFSGQFAHKIMGLEEGNPWQVRLKNLH